MLEAECRFVQVILVGVMIAYKLRRLMLNERLITLLDRRVCMPITCFELA